MVDKVYFFIDKKEIRDPEFSETFSAYEYESSLFYEYYKTKLVIWVALLVSYPFIYGLAKFLKCKAFNFVRSIE